MTESVPPLPSSYIDRIASLLGPSEAEAFFRSYSQPRAYGLRLNPLKLAADSSPLFPALEERFGVSGIPWCRTGYYYNEHSRPGKHPYHAAGL